MQICGGGNDISKANNMGTKMTVVFNGQQQEGPAQQPLLLAPASRALLLLGEIHVLYPPVSGIHDGSYYLCLGWMLEEDHIYPVPGFVLTTQKQVLCSIWRPRLGTFKHVLDTIPRELPNCPKVPQRMLYCSEEIFDVDGCLLYFSSKEDLSCHINHH